MTDKSSIWRSIADALEADISAGRYPIGARLPSEADLAGRFGVNRHTVRRALSALADAGRVHARRGAGVFVRAAPADYPIRSRVRFHQAMREAGRSPEKRILQLETRPADSRERAALGLADGAEVHSYRGVSLSDDSPLALFHSVFPAERLPALPEALRESGSVTAALAACGVPDFTRASTRLSAEIADPVQAGHLHLKAGDALLRSVSINIDGAGLPIEYGRTWFAGDRITLVVDG
ncbi:phosphonate metabolism transcriptional regulator PhnF [Roseovarius aquimarinus]|uniref:Phosphonate metabolism transcriptional regulator PhnF n=1 Tax=Roseovarius aquimarinus TaxID=1229156 RepID=A0ABW7I6V0_9RHOB